MSLKYEPTSEPLHISLNGSLPGRQGMCNAIVEEVGTDTSSHGEDARTDKSCHGDASALGTREMGEEGARVSAKREMKVRLLRRPPGEDLSLYFCCMIHFPHGSNLNPGEQYRDTSLIRSRAPLGPCSRPMPRTLAPS